MQSIKHPLSRFCSSIIPFAALAVLAGTVAAQDVRQALPAALSLELNYAGEALGTPDGGARHPQASKYRGNVELIIETDLSALGFWPGVVFHVRGEHGHGTGITDALPGAYQPASNIEAHDFTQVSEYWLGQAFYDGHAVLKLGKQDANNEFVAVEFASLLINGSFGATSVIPLPTFPHYGLGLSGVFHPMPSLKLAGGIYDGGGRGTTSGFDTAFDGHGGSFAIFELGVEPSFSTGAQRDNYRIGYWSHSANLAATDTFSGRTHESNYGVYAVVDKLLWLSGDARADDELTPTRALGAFLELAWAPAGRNEISRYLGTGLHLSALWLSRPDDRASIGVAYARISGNTGGGSETVIELTYSFALTPTLAVQPDLQYYVHPDGAHPSALVCAIRLGYSF